MKKDKIFLIVLAIIVIGIIFLIYALRSEQTQDEKIIRCIAKNSELYASKTCPACASQKQLLKDQIAKFDEEGNIEDYFNLVYSDENPEQFQKLNIKKIPTWRINDENYVGVQSITKLKELTNC